MSLDTTVLMFAKPPLAGKAKTRLAAEIGQQAAIEVYRYCIASNLEMLKQCQVDYQIWVSEATDHPAFAGHAIQIQQGTDLGQRMYHAINQQFVSAAYLKSKVILIGSDCIELTPRIIHRVEQQLSIHDLVLIPALDGGYVLIATGKPIDARLFEGINWGGDHVLIDTLEIAMNLGIKTCVLNHLRDIDHADDLTHYDALKKYLKTS